MLFIIMKRLLACLTIVVIHSTCTIEQKCEVSEHDKFIMTDKDDIAGLEKINNLILRNFDSVMKESDRMTTYKNPNKFDSTKSFKSNFYFATPVSLERCLNVTDSIEFIKVYKQLKKGQRLNFVQVDFRASDSTFDYTIMEDICDSAEKQIDIYHHLLYRINIKNYLDFKNADLAAEKQITNNWTYYIDNIIHR